MKEVASNQKLQVIESNHKLLPERAAQQIMQLIIDRALKAGEKLPNEFDMAQQLNVGRGTIREAVKILVSKNVVEIRRGLGTFVCERPGIADDPLGFAFAEDKNRMALDLCQVRLIIEPEIAAMAARCATEEEILEIQQAAGEVEALCECGEPHLEKDIAFHEAIARSTHNQVMPNLIPVIQSGVSLFIDITDSSLIRQTLETHRRVVDAIKARDPGAAREAMALHICQNRDKIREKTGLQEDNGSSGS